MSTLSNYDFYYFGSMHFFGGGRREMNDEPRLDWFKLTEQQQRKTLLTLRILLSKRAECTWLL